ncbi:GGDEF domain-containing protein [Thiomicrorhabdus sp. zzn3]|uniref:GGDEF domain-containing protein n=1 Tax=Thiomicrorhabdus sp. zzn3 TaxID=3039775 RepID=UPI00243724F9|nr:GGDEF domain-containing protein [Thiomicrorhabdus sp. zzn3]MDG6777694.1 GGDEF domain-containing protein [Thiomicrorhabdus sp. zzn3]
MNHSSKQRNHPPIFRSFLISYSILILLFVLLIAFWYQFEAQHEYELHEAQERQLIAAYEKAVMREYEEVLSDLLTITALPACEALTSNQTPLKRIQRQLAKAYLNISRTRARYDQIRFLNNDGQEIIRINYNNGQPSIVPENHLQNKSHRYYVQDISQLGLNQIYVSRMDLNIEHNLVERPFKPMIRVGVKLFSPDGSPMGMVVLNYLAEHMRQALKPPIHSQDGHSELSLLDQNGYWLKNVEPEKEWGFMFEEKQHMTLAKQKPHLWQKLKQLKAGQILTKEGLYTFKTLSPLEPSTFPNFSGYDFKQHHFVTNSQIEHYEWILVSFLPKTNFAYNTDQQLKEARFFIIISLIVMAFIAFILASYRSDKSYYQNRTQFMAYHDELTGAYNRHALFHDKEHTGLLGINLDPPLTLFFIDLDGFKPINDEYGHHIGDEVLKIIAKRLQNIVRSSDIVIRMGGDEFVIITPDLNEQNSARHLGKKLLEAICAPMHIESVQISMSASIGIAISTEDAPLSLEQMLDSADSAMYLAKQSGKNQIHFAPSVIEP